MDTLDVLYGDQLVGKLWQTEKGRLIFQYVQKWVQSGFDISVSLPLQKQPFDADEARPFFANILPEESVRRRIAKKLGISEGNDYALLEAIGGECAGALTVIPEGKAPETISEQYKELSDVELNFLIRSLPQRPLLAGERGVRLSLAGAQDKLPVVFDGRKVSLPMGGAPSTHILKTPIPNYEETVQNEVFSMRLARAMKLNVPDTSIHFCDGIPLCMVKRFDREVSADKIERLHQEDFCQALGVMPSMKYEAEGGPGFKDCFQLVRQKCGVPAKEMKQLLAWVIYNYLLGNADAHAKNVSLLYMGKAPTLAPFYDLMSTQVYGKQLTDKMAMKIGKEKRLDHVMPRHWRGFAEDAGLRSAMVLKELEKMAREMPGKAEEVFGDFEKEYGPSEVCHRVVELIEKRARTAAIRIEVEQDLSWREGQSED